MPPSATPRTNVILVGFMGSGKSSIGRLVASKLRFRFIDTDHSIVERAGLEISEIFARHGETHFRDLESSALESMAHLNRHVIATGGGIVLRKENCACLRELGFVVGLKAGESVILERISRNTRRPLLQTSDPRGTIRQMLAERQPLYEAVARFTIDSSDLTHAEVAAVIITEARRAFAWEGDA